ncbi:tRNA pseudouridine synthase A [Petrotoga mexicana DSM 14811]|uniref:tRNA pseudouridine synthase A n=1 Tax=Petrotoga mexicana DSM 14811 TaxID=1122954 RepID=A0A2K1P8F5_9BACT|nr:tRNA pseudouridine(38-40) synthase TruA [Petrotoga mexicana]PNR99072.1 tRNA pseudouridine synthase A [Petrotoga mexicana DSM 14811]
MKWVAARVMYDGTNFYGYQSQPTFRTVQDEFEKALKIIFKKEVPSYACGRTDTGVHAVGQVISFKVENENMTERNIKDALNAILPEDVYVKEVREVKEGFNPRSEAKKRIYHYFIYINEDPNIFLRNRVWWIPFRLNLEKMRQAARYFEGEHDFTSFKTGNDERNPIRTIYRVRIIELRKDLILIRVEGKSFLRRMVRNIVGALVKVGTDVWEVEKIQEILEAKKRALAPASAPPQGLYFYSALF